MIMVEVVTSEADSQHRIRKSDFNR